MRDSLDFQALKKLLSTAGLYAVPCLLIVIYGWMYMPHQLDYIKEVVAFGLLTMALFCLGTLFAGVLFKWISRFFLLILGLLAFIKLSFYINYQTPINASALFVIFETNGTEAGDFLSRYFSIAVVILLVILVVFLVYAFAKAKHKTNPLTRLWKVGALVLFCLCLFIIYKRFQLQNIPITSYQSYKEYTATKALLQNQLATAIPYNLQVSVADTAPALGVVIIGESTTRTHMSLYGYERETNPGLSRLQGLHVYEDVITPHVHTVTALEEILTLSDASGRPDGNYSIVQLANAAGYKTYWISNQQPVGLHQSVATQIGSAASVIDYVSSDHSGNTIYDEALLPAYEKALVDPAEKKLIFLHLIGTHTDYKKRVPKFFDYFTNKPKSPLADTEKKQALVNDYDNAVRYNDFIIAKIIEKTKVQTEDAFVNYFSDHGDEVYDTKNLVGHNEYHGTASMYEVPFLLWQSDNIEHNYKTKYMLDDYIHSFADLIQTKSSRIKSTRSIFNTDFKPRTRIIKDSIDYDKR